ncbi:hypothetical protein INR49_031945 [Caranx melampygus]|nr:hypothetical protein INR49_031945 [Caranx melampygus]
MISCSARPKEAASGDLLRQGKPCWHEANHCQSAQSEVEMAVWKAEHSGLSVRPHLLQLSQQTQTGPRQVTMHCKVCLLDLSSPESFYKHCSSLEHARLLSEDTTTKWSGRQPPHNRRDELWLCQRPQTCEYGNMCPKAHSNEELEEWMMRIKEEKMIRDNIDAQGLMSYNERLLEEYRNSSNEVYIRQLEHVALLKQEPGALFTLGDISSDPCLHSSGDDFLSEDKTYDITVSFTSINSGLYDQWTEEQEELLKRYKPPQISFQYKSSHNSTPPLNNENYKERMHHFLYNEEHAEDQVVSRLNVCGEVTTLEMLNNLQWGMTIALQGELYCAISIPCNLTPDTPEGLVLRRSIQSEGYFTHILIDEASQMLECEALMALDLAGPNTRVVLAGDHMQMGPKLFSVDDHHRSDHTLLNRLFHFYQGQKCDAAQNSRIIFSENYRSTKEIVEFVSTHFYVGKNDVIKASGDIPAPQDSHALKFHHVRGECVLDPVSMTWYNDAEVRKVTEAVKGVLEQWPLTWGPRTKDQSVFCQRGFRVYSQQVEMLDYPYPDCNLQFSQRTLRQEHSKPELRYKKLLTDARAYELKQHDIILCTCTQSSTPSLTKSVSARQILIDECAMATEPQALIPLVCNKPEKIVLIGDHKQLRPIVKNEHVRKLGMAKSLFERYYSSATTTKSTVMLDTQYRMIEIAEMLVKNAKIEQQSIVILSPYNAQVSEIRAELREKKMNDITVTTITKSQGSEWRYVIISTVCSVPSEEIESEPERSWLSKNLGFVTDPNQINVGITRAKEGLCIIGNQELLSCSGPWKKLLRHYRHYNAVTDADKISVEVAT